MSEFERLVARCKGEVSLRVNEHRSDYETKEAYVQQLLPSADVADMEQLLAGLDLYWLAFYPDTPVGFYSVLGSSLAEVVAIAHKYLDEQRQEGDNSPALGGQKETT